MTAKKNEQVEALEQQNADLNVTIAAQTDELVSQLNTILALRREITVLRATLNGASVSVET